MEEHRRALDTAKLPPSIMSGGYHDIYEMGPEMTATVHQIEELLQKEKNKW
jgi:hypothetical protein